MYANEDDETATSAGTVHSPDAKDVANGTLRLRAERVDSGNGRVYLIVARATDTNGHTGFAVATVVVPKSPSNADARLVNSLAAARTYALANNGSAPAGYVVSGDGPVVGPKQ